MYPRSSIFDRECVFMCKKSIQKWLEFKSDSETLYTLLMCVKRADETRRWNKEKEKKSIFSLIVTNVKRTLLSVWL